MSVLKLLLVMVSVGLVAVELLLDMFAGKTRLTPPTRNRRLNLGMSKGRSPKSTDVALPEAPEFCESNLIFQFRFAT